MRLPPGCRGEGEEIPIQTGRRGCGHGWIEEEPAEFLSGAKDFAAARSAPARVVCREVEQLERARQGRIETILAAELPRANRPLNFASHISHLLDEREGPPTLGPVNRRRRDHASHTR
jgi:hypothetical protein